LILIKDCGTRNKRNQLNVIATIQSQILHLPLVDKTPDLTRRGVYGLARGGYYLDRLCDKTWFENDIHCEARVRHHGEARLRGCLEAVLRCFDAVVASG
jgi:hypothetical protein